MIRARTRMDMSVYGDILPAIAPLPAKFCGADLSLTSTGLATIQYGRVRRGLLSGDEITKSGPNKGKRKEGTPDKIGDVPLRGVQRLEWLEAKFDAEITGALPELVAIEGYSFGSQSNHHSIGEWGGVAKLLLRRRGIPMILFSPNSIKKFISGNHQAKKPEVVLSLFKRYGIDEPQDDKADAVVLSIMSACIARPGIIELAKFQKEALAGVEII